MNIRILLYLGIAACLCGCQAVTGIQGSGKRVTEERKVEEFSRIEVIGAATIDCKVGPPAKLELEIDDNLTQYVTTEVVGDTLTVKSTRNISSKLGPVVRLSVSSLSAVAISGSGEFKGDGIEGRRLQTTISGSGTIRLAGRVEQAEHAVNGSGSIAAFELSTTRTEVSIRGSGTAEVDASERLDVSITGSGNVVYSGQPSKIERSVSGSGEVTQRAAR